MIGSNPITALYISVKGRLMSKVKKAKLASDVKAKYDYSAHVMISASTTRPCHNCGRASVHKATICKK